jgi:hypothetical protein
MSTFFGRRRSSDWHKALRQDRNQVVTVSLSSGKIVTGIVDYENPTVTVVRFNAAKIEEQTGGIPPGTEMPVKGGEKPNLSVLVPAKDIEWITVVPEPGQAGASAPQASSSSTERPEDREGGG